jgi:predicted nucleic acid-binding protein
MTTSLAAVVDSGLAVFCVLDTPHSEVASQVWKMLLKDKVTLYAPHLWRYEVTSVIHKYLFDKILTPDEAEAALQTAFDLSVNLINEEEALFHSAFHWSSQLNQRAAYDGFYLALAENLGAPFWTSDGRLTNRARQIGVNWVHWMGELSG